MFVWKTRQLYCILFPRVVRLKTELFFFVKVLLKKLIKIKTRRIDKGPHYRTSITNNKITAAHTVWCVYWLSRPPLLLKTHQNRQWVSFNRLITVWGQLETLHCFCLWTLTTAFKNKIKLISLVFVWNTDRDYYWRISK